MKSGGKYWRSGLVNGDGAIAGLRLGDGGQLVPAVFSRRYGFHRRLRRFAAEVRYAGASIERCWLKEKQ